jgi:hypothetical protein
MARRADFLVYVVGVMVLGLSYYALKHALSGPVLFAGVLAYLILLRLIGRMVATRMSAKDGEGNRDA